PEGLQLRPFDPRLADEPDRQRIDRDAAAMDLVVEVRPGREAARPDVADQLALSDPLAGIGDDPAHVRIAGRPAVAVGDADLPAIAAGPAGAGDLTACRGNDRQTPAAAEFNP